MMTTNSLKLHFLSLHKLLVEENENKWANEINKFVELLNSVERGELSLEEAKPLMQKKYKSMHHPHGGFGDFHLWRDDFNERKKINEQFSQSANAIWNELNI